MVGDEKGHVGDRQLADVSGGVELVAFTLELPLAEDPEDPAWESLAGGTGTVFLRGWPCPFWSYPTVCNCEENAVVTAATLEVVLGTGVPNADRSWSTIKALYR